MKASFPSIDLMMGQLDGYMRKMVTQELSGKICNMAEYHLGWRDKNFNMISQGNMGKRGRPMLSLLVSLLFNEEYERVFPVAAAIEMVHNFSLIFDDIQDKDNVRRGRPALWTLWGEDEAINVGCALQSLASLSMSEMAHYFPQNTVHETQKYLNRIMLQLCHGQQMDVSMTKTKELIGVEQYLNMISGKTAALFEAAAYLGALCAEAGPDQQRQCREFGYLIGVCFQLFDDAVGMWGMKNLDLDKPSMDLEKRKKTYPIIYAYHAGTESQQRDLLTIYFSEGVLDGKPLLDIRKILQETDALKHTMEKGYIYLDKAIHTLNQVEGNEDIKQAITAWVEFVTSKQIESTKVIEAQSVSASSEVAASSSRGILSV